MLIILICLYAAVIGRCRTENVGCSYDSADLLSAIRSFPHPDSFADRTPNESSTLKSILCYNTPLKSILRVADATDIFLYNTATGPGFDKETFFRFGYQDSVVAFSLQKCRLRYVADVPYRRVRVLNFRENEIDTFDMSIFDRLVELRSIDLSYNKLDDEDFNASISNRTLGTVTEISLAANLLHSVPSGFLSRATELKFLSLARNRITALQGFAPGLRLEILDLSYNRLVVLDAESFKYRSLIISLKIVRFDNNRLAELPGNLFRSAVHLREIHLQNNQLTSLPTGLFSNQTELEFLSLAHNELTEIPDDLFRATVNLKHLTLSNLFLTSARAAWLSETRNLRSLDLGHNSRLEKIDDDLFLNTPRLTLLTLSRTGISRVPSSLKSLNRLQKVDLAGTTLSCTCDNQWFASIRWFSDPNYNDGCSEVADWDRMESKFSLRELNCPPTISYITPKVNYKSGTSVELKCRVHGYPQPAVFWKRLDSAGRQVTDLPTIATALVGDELRLSIDKLTTVHLGVYMCKAFNPNGRVVAETSILSDRSPAPAYTSGYLSMLFGPQNYEYVIFEDIGCCFSFILAFYFFVVPSWKSLGKKMNTVSNVLNSFHPVMLVYVKYIQKDRLNELEVVMEQTRNKLSSLYEDYVRQLDGNLKHNEQVDVNQIRSQIHAGILLATTIAAIQKKTLKKIKLARKMRRNLLKTITSMELDTRDTEKISSHPLISKIAAMEIDRSAIKRFIQEQWRSECIQTDDRMNEMENLIKFWCSTRNIEVMMSTLRAPWLVRSLPAYNRSKELAAEYADKKTATSAIVFD